MSLAAPLMLLGLLGVGLPVLAHLLGRKTPRVVSIATLRFLPTSPPRLTQRRRVHDLPLFLVRAALLVAIVLAVSRPMFRTRQASGAVAVVHDAIVVFDDSRSMGLRTSGETLADHALHRVDALLEAIPTGSRIGLTTTDPSGPRLAPGASRFDIVSTLEAWSKTGAPHPGAWSTADALASAAATLRELDETRPRYIYLVSDRTAGGLGSVSSWTMGPITIVPIPAIEDPQPSPAHVGLTDLRWEPAPEIGVGAIRIVAVVRRFVDPHEGADAPDEREVSVRLSVAGTPTTTATVRVTSGDETPVEFTHTLTSSRDPVPVSLTIVDPQDDPLPSDDTRYAWLVPHSGAEVLVVNGDPSELRAHDETFFFNTALASDPDQRIRLRSMALDQFETGVREQPGFFDDLDVLVLANVQAPSDDVSPRIVSAIERGLGLWIAVGDRVQPALYNERFEEVLPLLLRDVVEVGTAPGRRSAQVEGLAPATLTHPIFTGVRDSAGLEGTQTRRVVLLEPDPRRPHEIALSFSSGAPALVTRSVGEGRVAFLATTLDRDWTDLPLRPGFVPLVLGTLADLAGVRRHAEGSRVWVGQPREFETSSEVTVLPPGGGPVRVRPQDGRVVVRDTRTPGPYRVEQDGAPLSVFSVDVDPSESHTEPVFEDDREGTPTPAPSTWGSRPGWRGLLWGALALLALESILRARRGSRADGAGPLR